MAAKKHLAIPSNRAMFAALNAVDEQINARNKKRERLIALKIEKIKSFVILCTSCAKRSKMFEWTFIQNHWYERPHGCTEGAEWWPNETETCHIVCPHCHAKLYIYTHPQKNDIVKLVKNATPFGESNLFNKIERVYD